MAYSKRVQQILDLVKSVSELDAASYSHNTHAIFDDYNLCCQQQLYNAMTDYEHWLEFINRQTKENIHTGEDFIKLLRDVLRVCDTLGELLDYTDDELEDAEDILHGEV